MLFLCYSFTLLGQSDVVGAASFTCSTLAENFGKVICGTHELLLRVGSGWLNSKIHVFSTSPEVFDRMPIISAKLSVRVTGADKAGKGWKSRCLFDFWDRPSWSLGSPTFEKASASSIFEIGLRGFWAAQLLRKQTPLRFLRSTLVISKQPSFWESKRLFDFWAGASSISEAPSSADFYRGWH